MRIIAGKFRGKNLLNSDNLKLRPTSDKNREALFNILLTGKFIRKINFNIVGAGVLDLCCGTGAVGFEALSRGAKSVLFIDNNYQHLELVKKNAAILQVQNDIELLLADAKNLPVNKNLQYIPDMAGAFKKGLNLTKGSSEKPGFFKEFLGGQVCEQASVSRYTCSQANLSNNKITKKDSFSELPKYKTAKKEKPAAARVFNLIFIDPPYAQDYLPIITSLLANKWIAQNSLIIIEFQTAKEAPNFTTQILPQKNFTPKNFTPKNFTPKNFTLLDLRSYGKTTFAFFIISDITPN